MKIKLIILISAFISLFVTSCYKDLGNYEYAEINEITIEGIEPEYTIDVDKVIEIKPNLVATQYSDTTKFTFQWTFDGKEVATTKDLTMTVNLSTGQRNGKYIITDIKTGVKTYTKFLLNVSSATAGDLYVVLSKSKGKAELSYLRLDKENSEFVVNYFEDRMGFSLGTKPQQLSFVDFGSTLDGVYPYINEFGGSFVLVDNKSYIFNKSTMDMDTLSYYLKGENYSDAQVYPRPDISGYKSEFINSQVVMWRILNNGKMQQGGVINEVSGGAVYSFAHSTNELNVIKRVNMSLRDSPNCYFSPFCYYDAVTNDFDNRYKYVQGFRIGNLMVFDKSMGRFAYITSGLATSIPEENIPAYPNFDLIYGSRTNDAALQMAVLADGTTSKMLLINKSSATKNLYSLIGDVVTSNVINRSTKFYKVFGNSYLLFATGDKLYSYNILNIKDGIAPSESNVVARLSDYGYESGAEIKDICVSRSEKTMLLGVSRYGSDFEAMSDENKGDLVVLNFDNSSIKVSFREIYKGISGLPVDVEIKYQNFYRHGINYETGVLKDQI